MLSNKLFLVQRLTALVMVPLIFGHLATMIYAIRGGLSATEILSRTQGSIFWGLFYGLFVVAVSLHAAIGLRVMIGEYFDIQPKSLNRLTLLLVVVLLYLGTQAVFAVILS